jgi:hypothetical protein
MSDQFIKDLHHIGTRTAALGPELQAQLAESFRCFSSKDKHIAREELFKDLVRIAEQLGAGIGLLKKTISIPEGFHALPLNGVTVQHKLKDLHRQLVDAAATLTDAGGLLYPEGPDAPQCESEGQ